ncbi:hypothetical protein Tco_0364909 [Tanacetum coccineum]
MNQEVTHQVAARDKNYKAFTISAKVPEIFMHQFWYTVKKVSGSNSYEFLLANKKYVVDVEVFRKILDICPRFQGVDFAKLPDDETTLTFLLDLDYKGPLHKHPNMENVDYPKLIWEDFAFQIDYRQLKKGRRKNMPYPRLKFVRIGEDYQEYGLPIPETMLTGGIKKSESYRMFIKYSTGQIPSKKSRGKGSQGNKITDTTEETVDVSEESDPGPARKRTASRRVVKKKVTITADDNIIPEPDIASKLGKSISLTEAAKEEAARKVHVTHARIVTEPIPEPARRRPSQQIVADTMKALKESKKTCKRQPSPGGSSEGTSVSPGVLDESTVVPATSSEGIGTKPRVPDEEKVTSESNVILEWGSEQESEYSE